MTGRSAAPGSGLGIRLEDAERRERQRAMRALLSSPLLHATGAASREFALVRRHSTWLRDWLSRYPGWALIVEAEHARLRKTPADLSDSTRGARDRRTGLAFTRRRYALFCLVLGALERSDRQTTLAALADEVARIVAAEPEFATAKFIFDQAVHDQRRDLVQAIRLLLDIRVLVHVEGDEDKFVSHQGDVLYNIDRTALLSLLITRRGPSLVSDGTIDLRIRALAEESLPDTDEARNRALRAGLVRRLLDDPIVYYDSLTPEELSYLHGQRHLLLEQIEDATGLVGEVRREGIALVDTEASSPLSDVAFPEEGTDGHVALLLAEELACRLRREPQAFVATSTLEAWIAEQVPKYRGFWRRSAREVGAERQLVEDAVGRLEALRLVRRIAGGVVPLPGIARFTYEPPSLFALVEGVQNL